MGGPCKPATPQVPPGASPGAPGAPFRVEQACSRCPTSWCCRSQYAAVVAANLLQCAIAIRCTAELLPAAPAPGTLLASLPAPSAVLAVVACGCMQLLHLAWSHPLPFRCGNESLTG